MSIAAATLSPGRGDRRRTLITPEGIALPVKLASRGTRFGALLIDLVIIVMSIVLGSLALFFIGGKVVEMSGAELGKSSPQLKSAVQFVQIFYLAALFLLRHGYFLYFELGPRGATPGKR